MGFPDPDWMAAAQARINADPELAVIGGWFSLDMGLGFGERRYVVRIREGRLVEVLAEPRFDVACRFVIRGPEALWRKFLQPTPPPLYHDIFAMIMRVPEFVLEGDTLAAMQNARALQRMMTVLREVGA